MLVRPFNVHAYHALRIVKYRYLYVIMSLFFIICRVRGGIHSDGAEREICEHEVFGTLPQVRSCRFVASIFYACFLFKAWKIGFVLLTAGMMRWWLPQDWMLNRPSLWWQKGWRKEELLQRQKQSEWELNISYGICENEDIPASWRFTESFIPHCYKPFWV